MDATTKKLVTESWDQVLPISDQAAELFYKKLFELNPDLKLLFKSPIPVQGKLLMKALDGAVKGLDDLESLVPVLQALGARHTPYGVAEKDYATVGEALLWTLGEGLQEAFTDDVKAAWVDVYGTVSGVMIAAQNEQGVDGPISPRAKRMVQGSWELVVPIADDAAKSFYARLFELDPKLKKLFPDDLTEQGKKLMQMLSVAVKGLDRLEAIVPAVQDLGRRHVAYGVKDADYETVEAALLHTLEQGLGDSFSSEVRESWTSVYTVLADTMKAAAAEEVTAPPRPVASEPELGPSDSGAGPGMFVATLFAAFLVVHAFI